MEETDQGIVVRTRPFSDTSLIVEWIASRGGRLSCLAKGARRPKSPLRGNLDLFHECEFTFRRSRRSDLHTLKEARLIQSHAWLRRDMARLEHAAFAVRLIEMATERDTPLEDIYPLLRDYLRTPETIAPETATCAFETKLLDALGLAPDWTASTALPDARRWLARLSRSETFTHIPTAAATTIKSGRHLLRAHWIAQFGRRPKEPDSQ